MTARRAAGAFLRDDDDSFLRADGGATLLEFAVVLGVFLFLLFGLIDFARLGHARIMAEKATEVAVRMAVVRPVVCPGVPVVVQRSLVVGTLSLDLPNGSSCTARSGLCRDPGPVTCTGSGAAADEIWAQVAPMLPTGARSANLSYTYDYDAALNRVGTRYEPVVSVDIVDLDFSFISPLGALARFAGGSPDDGLGAAFRFPSMSASLPSEDLR